MTELYSRECVSKRHQWCDGTVHVPEDLIPAGQDSVQCRCSCHRPPRPAG